MKKLLIGLILVAAVLFVCTANAQVASNREYYHIEILNEWGTLVTSATQIDIQNTSGTAVAVYSTKFGSTEVGSTGVITTTIDDGAIEFWYAGSAIDITVTDATYTREILDFAVTDHRFMFPTFLTAMSGSTYGQTDDIDFTYGSWIIDGDTANRLDVYPDNDNATMAIGSTTKTADLHLFGGTTNYDAMWDASYNWLMFRDNAGIGFGAAAASGAVDYTIKTAGSTGALIVTAVTADDAVQIGDGTIATDFILQNTTTAGADIWWDDSAEIFHFGVTNTGVDVKLWGDAAGNYLLWDESEDELYGEDIDITLNEGSNLIFQDSGDATDWTVRCATAERLEFIPTETTDDQSVNLGNATNTSDLRIFGTTASTVVFDASGDKVTFNAYDMAFGDGDILEFGDSTDITIAFDGTGSDLNILGSGLEVAFGVSDEGMDVVFHGETGGDNILFDESADELVVEDITVNIMDDTILSFGDGDDVTMNYDEDGDNDLQVTGSVTFEGTVTAQGVITGDGATEIVGCKADVVTDIDNETLTIAESGTVFDNSGDGDGTIFTLPEASTAIGVSYTFVVVAAQSLNINPGAADDRFISPITNAVGDSIESSTAGDSVTVLCIGDDSWVITAAYPAATDWPDSD